MLLRRRNCQSQAQGARPRQPVGDRRERQVQLRRRNPNQQAQQLAAPRQHRALPRHVQEQAVAERLRARVQGVRAAGRLAALAPSLQVHAAANLVQAQRAHLHDYDQPVGTRGLAR